MCSKTVHKYLHVPDKKKQNSPMMSAAGDLIYYAIAITIE